MSKNAPKSEYASQKDRRTVAISLKAWEPFNQFCIENNLGKSDTVNELIIQAINDDRIKESLLSALNKREALAKRLENMSPEQVDKLLKATE